MKQCWRTLIGLLTLLSATPVLGQEADNMVHNPSFEEYRACPRKIDAVGVMQDADAWWQPTGGSSDYFNSCGARECAIPRNKMGFQPASSGEAYCGIYCSQENYREYLQTELKSPLVAGKRYCVSFKVSLADKSPHAVATLGALLTKERVEDSTRGILMEREVTEFGEARVQSIGVFFEPQVENPRNMPLSDTKGWTEIRGEFTAEGGEKFLTLGNFRPFNKSNVVPTEIGQTPLNGAYYYIDDVSVTCIDPMPQEAEEPEVPEIGEVVRLWEVYFATGKSEVLQQSYNELMRLKTLLEEHPGMKIELRGHTDGQGTIDYNQKLSERRAEAVAQFLMSMGIDKRRLTWVGLGKSEPISDNNTDEGRQKNRRVEYKVVAR